MPIHFESYGIDRKLSTAGTAGGLGTQPLLGIGLKYSDRMLYKVQQQLIFLVLFIRYCERNNRLS